MSSCQDGTFNVETSLPSSYPSRVKGFFVDLLPRALGAKIPYSRSWLGGPAGEVAYAVLLAGFVGVEDGNVKG